MFEVRPLTARAVDRTVYASCAASLALGLFFLFVWSPLPWGWFGIDFYHDRALRLASGQPFDTTDVPWGYAYYVAFFYFLFGPHVWLPLVGQVMLNAGVPLLVYWIVRPLADRRTAVLAALLTGLFSFNTIYASTLSSDAVCTVVFLASLWLFQRGHTTGAWTAFAASGLLAGLAPQFRPNLILFAPLVAAAYAATRPRSARKLAHMAVYLAIACLALVPWVVRNYRLTHSFLPTSTHGAVQLWYGTLQTGSYLESRAYNPRALFESPPFDYTSLEGLPIVVTAKIPWCAPSHADVALTFWTSRDSGRRTLRPKSQDGKALTFELPGQPAPTTLYYSFASSHGRESGRSVVFVSTDHLADMDTHGDLIDVFDLIRVVRLVSWHEPFPSHLRFDADRDNVITEGDVRSLVTALHSVVNPAGPADPVAAIERSPQQATVRFRDGSSLSIPRAFSGRITDVEADGDIAGKMLYARAPSAWLQDPAGNAAPDGACGSLDEVAVNEVFYRKEPHLMRRYTALALDNIRREPAAFAAASLYRMARLFIVQGSPDRQTAQQFSGSSLIYGAAFVASLAYLAAFAAGAIIAWRRRSPARVLLLPIAYVPVTICFVLTNMRYTVTVQPLMFVFVAIALGAAIDRWTARKPTLGADGRAA
jgi:hypothetical protein